MKPTSPAKASTTKENEPTFERAMEELTRIVEQLERSDLPLDESIRLFEQGMKLALVSQRRLDSAQKTVTELLNVSESGAAETKPFDTDASE